MGRGFSHDISSAKLGRLQPLKFRFDSCRILVSPSHDSLHQQPFEFPAPMCQPKISCRCCAKGDAMKHEEWDLPGSSLAVRSRDDSNECSASLRRDDAVISRADHFLSSVRQGCAVRQDLYCPRQGTASCPEQSRRAAVPNDLGPSGVSTPEARVLAAAIYSTHVSSKFRANSLKINKSGTHYSTHKSRGRQPHFRTLILIGPPKLWPVRVN